ncbi:MAG: proliferating cell nuclear antigen (pcna) [Actinobacteria bacterium]|jgi:proliferating cell nuclear antigen|uniref:Unannotated protein n=1 Tax=freshwater metagenome TaxID=449393 RepID=A0A6J6ECC2_9ZZZZ|nr:proliferating cell nuclear antigen (pcna) [Actinomycetota bacterium]
MSKVSAAASASEARVDAAILPSRLIDIKTIQSQVFRTLVEALKEIITDGNLEIDNTGIRLIAMDKSHTVLIHLRLHADKFESFYCSKPLILGLNMINFFKLIKTVANDDTLTLYVDRADENKLGIIIENARKNSVTTYKLKLIEINEATIHIPRVEFPSVITMPSATFQKVCREMSNISDKIEITSQGDRLILGCDGEFADQETVMKETTDGMHFMKQENPKDIIQGVFNLNHLILFTKCSGLCNTIEIYLKNEYPLIILYRVASLGEIKLCLAPELSA